jgi:hypothetical protein
MIRSCAQCMDTVGAWEYERRVPSKNELCLPTVRCQMDIDAEKLQQTVLALLCLNSFDDKAGGKRAWKALPWSVMDQLHEKGYISDPATKNKSVWLS